MINIISPEGLPYINFNNLAEQANVRHFVSGRYGGVSTGEAGSLNLSFSVASDEKEHVLENRRRLAQAMEVEKVVFPSQTHSDNIVIVTNENSSEIFTNTDALITAERNICIAVMSADCVPVLLYDKVNNVAAAIHAGWRGTVQEIVAKTIAKMKVEFGTDPQNILAGIGPSICQEVYEVGEEVIENIQKLYGKNDLLLKPGKPGKAYLNLWEANKIQLLQMGVLEANIEIAGICTFQNSADYFSARKSTSSGRFAAGIVLGDSI